MSGSVRESLSEFWAGPASKVGVSLLILLILVSVYVLATYPSDFGSRRWNNPAEWVDYPQAVPPAWMGTVTGHKGSQHYILTSTSPKETTSRDLVQIATYEFSFDLAGEDLPSFVSVAVQGVTFYNPSNSPRFEVFAVRPDGRSASLLRFAVPPPTSDETAPYRRHFSSPRTVSLTGNIEVARSIAGFLLREFAISISSTAILTEGPQKYLFGKPGENGNFEILPGKYVFRISAEMSPEDTINYAKIVVGGTVYGLLGTDTLGRDVFAGLLFGFPVALFIGVVTSTLTTAVGAWVGIISGYVGGKLDTAIQRIVDTMNNIPLLPILIFLVFILGQNIWNIVLLIAAFGWPGLTIVVRSMVLQVKSSQFVEAAQALGAKRRWIMARHIFPQVAPFIFAQLVFFTPSAILTEAGLSFLGLGDPSMPSWGQILEKGFSDGAIFLGYWWWIVPPGLLIVVTAVTFVLLALGLERVVNPKLRRMR